jgi:hypothetical protein
VKLGEPGSYVTFTDGDGAEHVVVLPPGALAEGDSPEAVARARLELWRDQGRAVYAEPLTLVSAADWR